MEMTSSTLLVSYPEHSISIGTHVLEGGGHGGKSCTTEVFRYVSNSLWPQTSDNMLYLWLTLWGTLEMGSKSENKKGLLGFPGGSPGKDSACNAGDLGSIPGLGRSPGEEKGCPLQDSGLEDSMLCIVHGVAKSQARLSNFHFHWSPISVAHLKS